MNAICSAVRVTIPITAIDVLRQTACQRVADRRRHVFLDWTGPNGGRGLYWRGARRLVRGAGGSSSGEPIPDSLEDRRSNVGRAAAVTARAGISASQRFESPPQGVGK